MKSRGLIFTFLASLLIPIFFTSNSVAVNPSCTPSSTTVTSAGYFIESFTATTTCDWTVPIGVTAVDVLIVGGGGGGGFDSGGGGGGGGVIYQTNKSVAGVVTITVGIGGNGGAALGNPPAALDTGSASSFAGVIALGGAAGPNYTSGTGNVPGAGSVTPPYGVGGKGSSWNGSSGTNGLAGDDGYPSTIFGSTVYFGGGGGGGGWGGAAPNGGPASLGGGGKGASSTEAGSPGINGTGGGGGASASSSSSGGAGGSGIVLVRFSAAAGDFTTGKSASTIFRTATTLIVTSIQASRVTFLANGKAIPGCKALRSTGSGTTYTATCAYRPAVHGPIQITATISPTASPSTVQTVSAGVATVTTRSGKR